jgi:hypothetical protein
MQIRQYTKLGDNLKTKLTTIALIGIASLLSILLLTMMTAPAHAEASNEPHPADAMWVEPSSVTFDASNASVGAKFNVTVWLNMTEDIFAYQIGMLYNRTQLKCARAAFTAVTTSNYFSGHSTSAPPPVIDTSFLGNGSILASESTLGSDLIPGPHNGSLIWAEFQVLVVPTAGNLTSNFDISTRYSATTWVKDPDLNKITISTLGNGSYTIIPEFEYMLILPIFLALTLLAIVMSKKIPKKEQK